MFTLTKFTSTMISVQFGKYKPNSFDPTIYHFLDLRPPKMRLECMCTYTLYGNIMSLQSVSLSGSQRDALLISFKDAKLSVVQHDPDTFDLKTLSLHYFEEEDIKVREFRSAKFEHQFNHNRNLCSREVGRVIITYLLFESIQTIDVL